MPLVKLKTNLKSIKFGNDQQGGGSSGQPFVEFPMPNLFVNEQITQGSIFFTDQYATVAGQNVPQSILDFYKSNRENPDFPIRGGGLKFNIGTQTFTLSSQIDKSRIKKFFESKPRGEAFLRKQIGLQLSNPKIETGNSFQAAPNSNILSGLLENTRIYNNGLNTLSQVGVQGTGTHMPRHGVFPLDFSSKYYSDIVGAQNVNNESSTNRLIILQMLKLSTRSANVAVNPTNVNRLGISYNRNLIFQYLGGPGSTYGIGSTIIKRYTDTSQAAIKLAKAQRSPANKMMSKVSMTYDTIMNQNLNKTDSDSGQRTHFIQDFVTLAQMPSREEYYSFNLGSGSVDFADKMNMLTPFMFNNSEAPWETTDPAAKQGTKDIIKFVFEAIENNNPEQSWAIFFRAMINGFNDSHQASINTFKYQGRGEDFYTYQGVSRNISFGFRIAVMSENELRPLYTKLNHLISQVYPDYSPNFGVMRAPIIRLTIGDYLYRVAGMLENVNVTVDDNSSWEINRDNLDSLKQLPHVINVQCSFKPIQDFLPRRENMYNTNVPFIGEQSSNQNKDYLSILGGFRINADRLQAAAISPTVSPEEEMMMPNENTYQSKLPVYSPPIKTNPFESNFERSLRPRPIQNNLRT